MIISNRAFRKVLRDCRSDRKAPLSPSGDSILLAIPLDEQYQQMAYRVFAPVLKSAALHTCSLIETGCRDLLKDARNNEVIELVLPEDIQKQPLLNDEIKRRLHQHQYRLALDLNPEFHPFSAAAVLKSAAAKRIGFRTEVSDHFYNIQISKKPADPIESSYRYMLQLLQDSGLSIE